MFRRRQSASTPAPASGPAPVSSPALEPLVPVDVDLGSAGALAFRTALAERRFGDLVPILDGCPTIEEEAWALQVAADDPSLTDELQAWCSAEPGSGLATATWGASLVSQAWAQRAGRRFTDVPPDERERFFETLRRAESVLLAGARMSPASPLPWMGLLRSARGLQVSRHEQRLRYELAMRRQAPGLDPHQQRMQGLCAKWGGSHEEMFAFARGLVAVAPAGSPLHTVLALAHLERGVAAAGEGGDLGEYMASVADEIGWIGQQSVEHPAFVDAVPDGVHARNVMCLCYSLCGEHELSQRQRVAMAGRLTRFPWVYLGAPEEVFRRSSPRPVAGGSS